MVTASLSLGRMTIRKVTWTYLALLMPVGCLEKVKAMLLGDQKPLPAWDIQIGTFKMPTPLRPEDLLGTGCPLSATGFRQRKDDSCGPDGVGEFRSYSRLLREVTVVLQGHSERMSDFQFRAEHPLRELSCPLVPYLMGRGWRWDQSKANHSQ